ncbi:MAG: hypothetical protein ABIE42_11475 [Candidatus Eisenbacteria bacterium]
MSQLTTATGRAARVVVAAGACGLFLLLALSGCGAPATFVSTTPPPDMTAEAWYGSSVPEVRAAISKAMRGARIAISPDAGGAGTIVGTKQQVPYVGRGAGEPAPGRLPVYRVRTTITRPGDVTHVRASIEVVCPSCGSKTPYEWEYPGNLFRDIFEGTRRILSDRKARVSYPPRHEPVRWRPPRMY